MDLRRHLVVAKNIVKFPIAVGKEQLVGFCNVFFAAKTDTFSLFDIYKEKLRIPGQRAKLPPSSEHTSPSLNGQQFLPWNTLRFFSAPTWLWAPVALFSL